MAKATTESRLLGDGHQYEPGEPFILCFCCGLCCIGHRVRLSLVEARRMADGLRIAWRQFEDKYVDQHWPGAESFFLRQSQGACVFLKYEEGSYKTSCLVHPIKPSSCREWTPSLCRRECQAGLARHWGLTVDSCGRLQGPDKKLRDFRSFLESLVQEEPT
jgi:Fe-S-cluster containining protein